MPKAYSVDLRNKVIAFLEKTPDTQKASQIFQIGTATIYRWVSQKKKKGTLEPKRRAYAYKRIDDQKLIKYVEDNPDHFLFEIGKHFNLTPQAIFYALRRLKITRKKKPRSIKKEKKR
jgi:transposase